MHTRPSSNSEFSNAQCWNWSKWLTVMRNAATIATASARAAKTTTTTNRSVAADSGVHAVAQKPGRVGVRLRCRQARSQGFWDQSRTGIWIHWWCEWLKNKGDRITWSLRSRGTAAATRAAGCFLRPQMEVTRGRRPHLLRRKRTTLLPRGGVPGCVAAAGRSPHWDVTERRRRRRRRSSNDRRSPPRPHPGSKFSAAARISSPPRCLRLRVTDHAGGPGDGDAMREAWREAAVRPPRLCFSCGNGRVAKVTGAGRVSRSGPSDLKRGVQPARVLLWVF
jgi:hypothetical protein